jgi:alkylmercury lyase-like protein
MPDPSHARKPTTEEAVVVCRSARLLPAAYYFYRAVLLTFVEQGDAPDPARVQHLAQRFGVPLAATLADMAAQDLVQCDVATGRIRAAYPFSGMPTPHRVALFTDHLGVQTERIDVKVFAMCALDALGIPLMLRRSARISSTDALTGEPLSILLRPSAGPRDLLGLPTSIPPADLADWQVDWDPDSIAVYVRPEEHEAEHDAGTCIAEGTCCPVTNFFRSADHAREWAACQPLTTSLDGLVLSQREALVRASTLFGGVLDRLPEIGTQPAG